MNEKVKEAAIRLCGFGVAHKDYVNYKKGEQYKEDWELVTQWHGRKPYPVHMCLQLGSVLSRIITGVGMTKEHREEYLEGADHTRDQLWLHAWSAMDLVQAHELHPADRQRAAGC